MNVFIVGDGAREHALAWKISQSPLVSKVYMNKHVPEAEFVETDVFNTKDINMAFIGPEQPLYDGIRERLNRLGIACFGPSSDCARLEASKVYAKRFMDRYDIPTAKWQVFNSANDAIIYTRNLSYEFVCKASCLASGKGVMIPDIYTADECICQLFKKYPSDGVIIEEKLEGYELSVTIVTDGKTFRKLTPARDYKQIYKGGPMTGGMGAISTQSLLSTSLEQKIDDIIQRTINGLRNEGLCYIGFLYFGLMICDDEPYVLEYNCRLGDPEAQVILPLLNNDLADIAIKCIEGRLDEVTMAPNHLSACAVVLASYGYPDRYLSGYDVSIKTPPDASTLLFYGHYSAGKTTGGRVLTCVNIADSIANALSNAYAGIKYINFDNMYYRRDITADHLLTYRDAGVDIAETDAFIDGIKPLIAATRQPGRDASIGGFSGVFSVEGTLLAATTDGVGTKLMLAEQLGRYDQIGIDLVAMCVNDLLASGAEPLIFLDYISFPQFDSTIATTIVQGIVDGCRLAKCALIGGETAIHPGANNIDMAGFAVGRITRQPTALNDGDIILGLPSSGVHSNGFSLLRRLVDSADKQLLIDLLTPTKIYIEILDVASYIKAAAHITGGGLISNINRVLNTSVTAIIDYDSWQLPGIFKWILSRGVTHDELFRVFNCGIGFVIIIDSADLDAVQNIITDSIVIGHIDGI